MSEDLHSGRGGKGRGKAMGRPACGNACLQGPGPWSHVSPPSGFASLSPDAGSGLGTAKLFSQVLYKRVALHFKFIYCKDFQCSDPKFVRCAL